MGLPYHIPIISEILPRALICYYASYHNSSYCFNDVSFFSKRQKNILIRLLFSSNLRSLESTETSTEALTSPEVQDDVDAEKAVLHHVPTETDTLTDSAN